MRRWRKVEEEEVDVEVEVKEKVEEEVVKEVVEEVEKVEEEEEEISQKRLHRATGSPANSARRSFRPRRRR